MARSIEFDVTANDKATGTLKGVKNAIGELSDRMAKMFTATALLDRGIGMAQQAISYFFTTLKNTADLKDLATAAGLTTDEYQRLAMAAEQAGLDQQGMMKGLKVMKEFLRDARVEGSKQAEVLKALGFSQEQISSGSIDAMDAMDRLSGAVEAAVTPQDKYNVAASVFGAKAQELIPLLDGLRTALRAVANEPIISAETIDKLDDVDKKLTRLAHLRDVLTAQTGEAMLTEPGLQMVGSTLLPVGGQGALLGKLVSDYVNAPTNAPAVPVTQKDKDAANALGKLGMSAATGGTAGMAGVSSAQSLGMATSIALAQQQTAYLATIAANTSPTMGSALPGRTNFTKPDATQAEVDTLARNIRFSKQVPIFPRARPAR